MHAHATARLVAPEDAAVGRMDPTLRIVRNGGHYIYVVAAPCQPFRRIGDERWDACRLRRVVRRSDEDAGHQRVSTAWSSRAGPGTSRTLLQRTRTAGLPT